MIYMRKLGTNTHKEFLDHLKRYVMVKQEKGGARNAMKARQFKGCSKYDWTHEFTRVTGLIMFR